MFGEGLPTAPVTLDLGCTRYWYGSPTSPTSGCPPPTKVMDDTDTTMVARAFTRTCTALIVARVLVWSPPMRVRALMGTTISVHCPCPATEGADMARPRAAAFSAVVVSEM